MFTDGTEDFYPSVDSIPLTGADSRAVGRGSLGDLVNDASAQISTLVRAEIELAKTEITGEVKKGAIGGGLFAVAGVIALYSTFFFFFFVAKLLGEWMPEWAGFLIVFLVMLAVAGVLALLGLQRVKKIRAPKNTIESVGELKKLVPGKAEEKLGVNSRGLYTHGTVSPADNTTGR